MTTSTIPFHTTEIVPVTWFTEHSVAGMVPIHGVRFRCTCAVDGPNTTTREGAQAQAEAHAAIHAPIELVAINKDETSFVVTVGGVTTGDIYLAVPGGYWAGGVDGDCATYELTGEYGVHRAFGSAEQAARAVAWEFEAMRRADARVACPLAVA